MHTSMNTHTYTSHFLSSIKWPAKPNQGAYWIATYFISRLFRNYLFSKQKVFSHISLRNPCEWLPFLSPNEWTDSWFLTHFKIIPNYLHCRGSTVWIIQTTNNLKMGHLGIIMHYLSETKLQHKLYLASANINISLHVLSPNNEWRDLSLSENHAAPRERQTISLNH